MKQKVTVNIDTEVYQKSHSLGINVSKACENYLKQLNQTIESANGKNGFLAPDSFTKEAGADPMGFEPMTFSLEGARGTAEYWGKFRVYVNSRIKNRTWRSTIYNYAQEYCDCLFKRDLSRLQVLADSKRPNVLKALSSLAKFDGCSDELKPLMKRYGLKWAGRSKDDVFIDRITNTKNPEEIWTWIKQVKSELPEYAEFMDLMAVSGLRYIEAVHSFNLISELTESGKLELQREGKNYQGGYYNREISSLEHFWFREIFLRSTKKAYVSFIPGEIVEAIGPRSTFEPGQLQQLVKRHGLPQRFSDIREAHGTFMVKYLKEAEINFLHGRVTSGVFMANYFNPSLIVDLRSRALQGVAEIQQKIKV